MKSSQNELRWLWIFLWFAILLTPGVLRSAEAPRERVALGYAAISQSMAGAAPKARPIRRSCNNGVGSRRGTPPILKAKALPQARPRPGLGSSSSISPRP